ncbi:sulfatase [Salmonella enterica]|nr:sulfatase [Salmonella enterica]SUG21532.1 sulfatase [Salmonella enterica subsp. arizonae]
MLSGAVKADEKCAVKAKPAWDKPFTGEIPEKLPEGYNILLVVTDQERFFATYPFPVPGRERLMKTGVTFCNHQNTSNVCTPSRSVLYTGLHMPQTKMFDNLGLPWMPYDLDPALGTTGHMMQKLGYYTAYKGKWHLTEKLEKPLPDEKDEDIDVGNIPEPELHKIMEKYGFSDYVPEKALNRFVISLRLLASMAFPFRIAFFGKRQRPFEGIFRVQDGGIVF